MQACGSLKLVESNSQGNVRFKLYDRKNRRFLEGPRKIIPQAFMLYDDFYCGQHNKFILQRKEKSLWKIHFLFPY